MKNKIIRRSWHQFVKQPEVAVLPILGEFYTNVVEHLEFEAFVKGKKVFFDLKTINQLYSHQNLEKDKLQKIIDKGNKYDTILRHLALEGIEWVVSTNNNITHFEASALTRVSNAWHYFAGACLMPILHFFYVTKERVFIVYYIENKIKFDVGIVIQ
ncbi:hypothetical protein REPUB_Repub07fG0081200 [Reevesia pubescens]